MVCGIQEYAFPLKLSERKLKIWKRLSKCVSPKQNEARNAYVEMLMIIIKSFTFCSPQTPDGTEDLLLVSHVWGAWEHLILIHTLLKLWQHEEVEVVSKAASDGGAWSGPRSGESVHFHSNVEMYRFSGLRTFHHSVVRLTLATNQVLCSTELLSTWTLWEERQRGGCINGC